MSGDTVDITASWSPTSVVENSLNNPTNYITLYNCTSSSQNASFSGTVSTTSCGGSSFAFGPISKMLTANQTFAEPGVVVGQAPACPGTYTQDVTVTPGVAPNDSATASFTVTM